ASHQLAEPVEALLRARGHDDERALLQEAADDPLPHVPRAAENQADLAVQTTHAVLLHHVRTPRCLRSGWWMARTPSSAPTTRSRISRPARACPPTPSTASPPCCSR